MKTRQGFVSNSSSSSFVLVVDKKTAEEVKKEISPYSKAVIDAMEPEEKEFNDIPVLIYNTYRHYENSSFDGLNIENEEELLKEANSLDYEESYMREESFEEFFEAIPENKKIAHEEEE